MIKFIKLIITWWNGTIGIENVEEAFLKNEVLHVVYKDTHALHSYRLEGGKWITIFRTPVSRERSDILNRLYSKCKHGRFIRHGQWSDK